jgi:hypothetical protein
MDGKRQEAGLENGQFQHTRLYTSGSSWIRVLTTSTGVKAPWVMAQPRAPARAKLVVSTFDMQGRMMIGVWQASSKHYAPTPDERQPFIKR